MKQPETNRGKWRNVANKYNFIIMGGEMSLKTTIIFALILLVPLTAYTQDDRGEKLYNDWCAQCHGYDGAGKGYASGIYTIPQPRDFTSGTYKFRTTPSGERPTDEDIIRSTRKGNPGTTMPPWERFTDDEVKDMVEYIKIFAEEEETFEYEAEPFQIGKPPAVSDAILKQGKEIYDKAKCWECHGKAGRGEGEKGWQENFKNDWGTRAYPTDLTQSWEYRGGATLEDIYRSVTSGFDGTPMASFQTSYSDEERWALSHFVQSLQVERKTGSALSVKKVDAVPTSTEDEQWNAAGYLDMPMSGQLMFKPRQFTPLITNVRVRGLYTEAEIAVMLEWTDKKPNKGDDGHPSDAVRAQFPVTLSDGAEKPYFYLGDNTHPVNLWYWKASDNAAIEQNAKGHKEDALVQQEKNDIQASANYSNGHYRVLFSRPLDTGDQNDITFTPGKFVPLSVTVFDGEQDEQGNRATISGWYYVMLEPPTPMSVYVMPPLVGLAFIGAGIGIRRKLKKD
jgi:DMSO reductase family type II enzyme heme b subunit